MSSDAPTPDDQATPSPPPREADVNLRGWITPMVGWLLDFIVRPANAFHGSRKTAQQDLDDCRSARRAIKVDTFVAICVTMELLTFGIVVLWGQALRCLATILVVVVMYRALMIPANAVLIPLFDYRNLPRGKPPTVASYERMAILGFINYIELILCFASLYALFSSQIIGKRPLDWFDYIYMSTITQLTVGYGEIHPAQWMRVAACLQGLSAFLVVFLLFGRFVALLRREVSRDDVRRDRGGGR